jgi:hypothetical protein
MTDTQNTAPTTGLWETAREKFTEAAATLRKDGFRTTLFLDDGLAALDSLRTKVERQEAVIEAARKWAERDDVWFAANEMRPFDAERVAKTSLAKRDAAKELRRALSALTDNEEGT